MGALRGIVVGGLGLTMLYNLTTTTNTQGITTLTQMPGAIAHWLIDPAVPLIPDHSLTTAAIATAAAAAPSTGAQSTDANIAAQSAAAGLPNVGSSNAAAEALNNLSSSQISGLQSQFPGIFSQLGK